MLKIDVENLLDEKQAKELSFSLGELISTIVKSFDKYDPPKMEGHSTNKQIIIESKLIL